SLESRNQPLPTGKKQRFAAGKQARRSRQTGHYGRKNQSLPERIALMATPIPLPLDRPLRNYIFRVAIRRSRKKRQSKGHKRVPITATKPQRARKNQLPSLRSIIPSGSF